MLKYNTKVEVTQEVYNLLMNDPYAGTCAGKEEDGKYYLKLLMPTFRKYLNKVITKIKQP